MKQVATAYHGVSVTKMWHLKYLSRAQGIAFKQTMAGGFYVERWIGVLSFVPQNYVDTACTNANSWFILNPLAHSNRIMLLSIRNCWVWNSLRQHHHAWGLNWVANQSFRWRKFTFLGKNRAVPSRVDFGGL